MWISSTVGFLSPYFWGECVTCHFWCELWSEAKRICCFGSAVRVSTPAGTRKSFLMKGLYKTQGRNPSKHNKEMRNVCKFWWYQASWRRYHQTTIALNCYHWNETHEYEGVYVEIAVVHCPQLQGGDMLPLDAISVCVCVCYRSSDFHSDDRLYICLFVLFMSLSLLKYFD